MTLSFHATTAPLFAAHRVPDPDAAAAADKTKSFVLIQDDDEEAEEEEAHSEVTDALLGFAYDPLDASHAALDDLLNLPLTNAAAAAAFDSSFLAPIDDGGATKAEQQRCSGDAWYAAGGENRNNNGGTIDDELLLSLPPSHAAAAAFLAPIDDGAIKADEQRSDKRKQQVPAALSGTSLVNDFVLALPPPAPIPVPTTTLQVPEHLVFAPGSADGANRAAGRGGGACQAGQNSAARLRRKRISEKTAELARLIPGAHKLNTAEMLEEGARHVKLLQAQIGMLALMRGSTSQEEEKMPMAQEQEQMMQALLASGGVQERLAAEGKCLVPMKLVDAVAKDEAVNANPVVRRELGRFVASLQQVQGQGQGQ